MDILSQNLLMVRRKGSTLASTTSMVLFIQVMSNSIELMERRALPNPLPHTITLTVLLTSDIFPSLLGLMPVSYLSTSQPKELQSLEMADPSCAIHGESKDSDKWLMTVLDTVGSSIARVNTYPKAMKYVIIIESIIQAVDAMSNSVNNRATDMSPRIADRLSRVSKELKDELKELTMYITSTAGPDGFINRHGNV